MRGRFDFLRFCCFQWHAGYCKHFAYFVYIFGTDNFYKHAFTDFYKHALTNNIDLARRVWKTYFPALDAIVFIVDAADANRINESRTELLSLLQDEQVSSAPVLILGNKVFSSIS